MWKVATGAVAASLLITSLASAVRISGGPVSETPSCPRYPPIAEIVGCDAGFITVAPGVKEFFFAVKNVGEAAPPGCPQSALLGTVQANIYGKRGGITKMLVATVQDDITLNSLAPGEDQLFRIKWLSGTARSGDEGIIVFGGVTCRVVVS